MRDTFDRERRRGGIVFCPTVVHAIGMAAVLRRYGITAECVSGEMSPREREVTMSRFRAGDLQLVASVDYLTRVWMFRM